MRYRYIGLRAMTERGKLAVQSAVATGADELVMRARVAAPKDSGALAAGIHHDGVNSLTFGGSAVGYWALISTGAGESGYAQYIHEGHNTHGTHIIGAYPSGSKYLEGPLLTMRGPLLKKMREAGRAAF